jgi:hypothetical protein
MPLSQRASSCARIEHEVIRVDAFGFEHPEFELDVVGVAKHDERSCSFVLHTRVFDPLVVDLCWQ